MCNKILAYLLPEKKKEETIDFDFLPKTFQSERFLFYFDCKRLGVTVVVNSWIILFWFLCLIYSKRKVFFISAGFYSKFNFLYQ